MSELGPDARALIDAARGEDEPSAEDRARVGRKLAGQLPAFAATAGLAQLELEAAKVAAQGKAAAGASGLLGSGLVKVATLSVAAVLAGSAAVVFVRGGGERRDGQRPSAAASPAAVESPTEPPAPQAANAAPEGVVAVAAEPRAQTRERPARAMRRAVNAGRAERTERAERVAPERVAAERRIVAPEPEVVPEPEVRAEPEVAVAVPRFEAREQERSVEAKVKVTAQATVPAPVKRSGPDPEAALLATARAAFEEGDAERTLDLTRRHAARYPSSALTEERVALQGLALCALHRFDEGLRVLHAPRAPHSPLHAAALRACTTASRPR